MKRYLAFFGDNYYPDGGMGDFLSDHDSLGVAENAILDADKSKGSIQSSNLGSLESSWGHVYDTVNKKIVYKK